MWFLLRCCVVLWIIFQLMPEVDHARLEQEIKENAKTLATNSAQAILKSPQAQQAILTQALPNNMAPELLRALILLALNGGQSSVKADSAKTDKTKPPTLAQNAFQTSAPNVTQLRVIQSSLPPISPPPLPPQRKNLH